MKWKQKNPKLTSIKEVVMNNTGLSEEELLNDKKDYLIKDIDKVISKLNEAKEKDIFITVVGDYDCDGVTSSSEWELMLSAKKIRHRIRLPKRHSEGYGLNVNIIDEINEGILITVDNGIAALPAIQKAKDKGLYVIVVDHHQPVMRKDEDGKLIKILPNADIIIDPHAIEDQADFNHYCGAGLTYKIAQKWFDSSDPILKKINSLAAIGTIADVVQLLGDNRKIVKSGLKTLLNGGRTIGLCELLKVFNIKERITAEHIGFGIAPAINACGRLGYPIAPDEASQAVELLTFKGSFEEARYLAKKIAGRNSTNGIDLSVNEARKKLVKEAEILAEEIISDECLYGEAPLVIYIPNINEGIIGIIAGHLTEKYRVPAIVFTDTHKDEDVIKASGRSPEDVNLKELLDKVSEEMLGYGGHPGAAGLAIKRDNLLNFREKIKEALGNYTPVTKEFEYDLEINENEVEYLLDELDKYGPYGEKNPQPVFLIKNFKLYPNGNSLYKISGTDNEHIIFYGENIKASGFWLYNKYLELGEPKCLNIIGTLDISYWNGKAEYGMIIKDMEAVEEPPKKRSLLQEKLKQKSLEKNIR